MSVSKDIRIFSDCLEVVLKTVTHPSPPSGALHPTGVPPESRLRCRGGWYIWVYTTGTLNRLHVHSGHRLFLSIC